MNFRGRSDVAAAVSRPGYHSIAQAHWSMKNSDMSKYDLDDRGLRPSSSLSSHLSEEGGGKLKRSSSSRETMMSRCATAASLPLMFEPNTDLQLSKKKIKSSAGLQNSNRASMPTIGVTTRSASRRSSNRNEEWDCIRPRDVHMNVFSQGLTRPSPKPSLDGPSQNNINERQMGVRRSAPRGSLKTDPVSLTSSQPTQNFQNLPAIIVPVVEHSIRNEETSRTRYLHRDISAKSMPILGVTTRSASRRSLNQNVEWECIKPKESVSLISSDENEEWDCCPNPRDVSMNMFSHGRIRPPPKPSLKSSINERPNVSMHMFSHGRIRPPPKPSLKSAINERPSDVKRSARRVIFSQTQKKVYIDCFDDIHIKWYSASEYDRFKDDATARAAIIERTMKYASSNDNTYNSSTGLTAPHVLKEYLSSAEEIIGIEHLLPSQHYARENLKKHHKIALVNELCLMRQISCDDPLLLADRLSDRLRKLSDISVHMARTRATYITLLD